LIKFYNEKKKFLGTTKTGIRGNNTRA